MQTQWRFFGRLLLAIMAALVIVPIAHAGDDTCGGQKSKGNPLSCCPNGGNCTWWAWKMAKEAGWKAIPIGNANTWDDFARAHSTQLRISKTPSPGAVGVKNSSPYECGTKKKPKTCDFGHDGWILGLVYEKGKLTKVSTSQMACGGSKGVTYIARPIGYYDYYITPR